MKTCNNGLRLNKIFYGTDSGKKVDCWTKFIKKTRTLGAEINALLLCVYFTRTYGDLVIFSYNPNFFLNFRLPNNKQEKGT
jgi:hypothetical protein